MQGEIEAAEVPASRFGRLAAALRGTLRLVVDVALPQLCPACRTPVDGAGLCPACWAKLSFIAPPYCERLGTPFPFDGGPGLLSMEAIADPPVYHRARAAVRYDEISSKLVHALKYGDRLDGRAWGAQAGQSHAAAGLARQVRAGPECAGRLPRAGRRQGWGDGPP